MNLGAKTILYPVVDLAASRVFFEALLGSAPTTDSNFYVGFTIGDQHIGLVPGQGGAPVAYYHVDDLEGTIKMLVDAGAAVSQEPKEVGGGRRIATVNDPAGSTVGLIHDA
jgi:predicted enzyme related to lactoylglutathione lyase